MKSNPRYVIQTTENKRALWVHDSTDGSTVGRFGRMGVDIHNSVTDQMNGKPECLFCTHGKAGVEDWELFRKKAKELWDLNIPVDAISEEMLRSEKGW